MVLCSLSIMVFIYFTTNDRRPTQSGYVPYVTTHDAKPRGHETKHVADLDIEKNKLADYVELVARDNTNRVLPRPRSHVVTKSSHVIGKFARNAGCTKEGEYGIAYQYLKVRISCEASSRLYRAPCRAWTWDPANWTLTLSDELELSVIYSGYVICAYPIIEGRVHKVQYANGSVDLPGCSPSRYNCTSIEPYFDRTLHMRINWSPCCREMNIKLLADTADLLEAQHVRYVLIGGACISVVRENGTFIPYDTDLDMMIDVRDRERIKSETVPALEKLGYYLTWHSKDTYVRFCVNTKCDAHIDTWFYEEHPTKKNRLKYHGMGFWEVSKDMILPTSWEYFEGKKYRFPRKIMDYLQHEYSSGVMAGYHNWKDVFLCNFKRGRKCTHYPE